MTDLRNAIDCDIHPAVPGMQVLLPYLDEYWREHLITRGTERLTLHMTSFPPNAPHNGRPDWKPEAGLPGRISRALQQACARCLRHPLRDLQCALCGASVLQRGHGRGALPRGQRLDGEGMAR